MSLRKASIILGKNKTRLKPPNLWDKAIADAKELIQESYTSVRQLKGSIAVMKQLRDKGAAFPGEQAIRNGADRGGP